ncbi:Skp1 family, tetramerization domain [Musa troglodytarum]|uniref:SKP1-like protein n=1 Tax=Musa troglodytarum TaxID=320322 RepID=A0A9E7FQP4_9LILI|nr:Skp1 family, tetramerization domain [Musa troglodytarum]
MASEDGKKMITLKSSDGQEFRLEMEACMMSEILMFVLDDCSTEREVPLPNVNGKTLKKVIEYLKKHTESTSKGPDDDELKAWDDEFMKVDTNTLHNLLKASDYMIVQDLLDLCVKTTAELMRGKRVEDIREIFNIKSDFTKEEEAAIKKANRWAFR